MLHDARARVAFACGKLELYEQSVAEVEETFGSKVWEPHVPRRAILQDAMRRGEPPQDLKSHSHYATEVAEIFDTLGGELNAATDNPMVFADSDEIVARLPRTESVLMQRGTLAQAQAFRSRADLRGLHSVIRVKMVPERQP